MCASSCTWEVGSFGNPRWLGGSDSKVSAYHVGDPVRSLGREDPLEKEMATHSNILAWKTPWMEEPGRLQSMGLQTVGHDWATSLSTREAVFDLNLGLMSLGDVRGWYGLDRGTVSFTQQNFFSGVFLSPWGIGSFCGPSPGFSYNGF